MVENAGIIQAKIQLEIDDLKKGAMEAQEAIKAIEAEAKKSNAETVNAFRNSTKAIFDYKVELRNIEVAVKTGSMTSKEAEQAKTVATKKYIDMLIDTRNRIAEVSGEESKEVAVYDKLIKKQVELRDSAKKTSEEIGKGVEKNIKDPFEQAGKHVKIFGVELGSLGKFGAALAVIATVFKAIAGAISAAIQKSQEYLKELKIHNDAMKALNLTYRTSVGSADNFWKSMGKIKEETKNINTAFNITSERMGAALDFWKTKITGVITSLGNLLFSVKEADVALRNMQNANMDNYKSWTTAGKAYEDELKNIQYLQDALSGTKKSGAEAEKEANLARQSANELYIRQLIQIRNNLLEAEIIDYEAVDAVRFKIREQVQLLTEQKKLAAETKAETAAVNLLTQAEKTRSEALAQIQNQENALFISHEEAADRRLQAEQQYIQTLSGLRTEYKQLEGAEDKQAANIAAIEAAAIANAKAIETTIKYQKEYAAETERLKAEYKNISAEMGNEATFAEIMAKEAERRAMQLERQRDAELAALETRYAAIAAEKESGELTEEETAHRDMLTEAINKNYDALKQLSDIQAASAAQQEIAGYAKEISDQYKDITRSLAEQDIMRDESLSDYEKEVALNNLARQAALDELKVRFAELEAQREGGALTEEEIALRKELTAAINKNYDEIASGIKKAEINFKDITTQIAQASVSAFTSITSAMSTIAQQQAQEAMAEVDRVLEETTQRIEEQRKAALEAEGFIEAQRAENMQAQIDAAIEANDEVLQYQLERRQREMEINEKYDAQAKEAEEAAKKDKAKLEYDAAKTAWEMDLAAAWASFPLTVMNAIESGWKAGSLIPVPGVAPALAATYAGLAGTAAGVQIAAIQKAEPKLKFADGGIVPGQPHANTDTIAAMLTPGEVILNRAQQETLAPQLESRPLVIQMTLDGRIISEAVINDYVNKGIVLIEARRGIR